MEAAPEQVMKAGLEFDEITATGALDRGQLHLDRATLDSPWLGVTLSGDIGLTDRMVELQGLVAPLDKLTRTARREAAAGKVLDAAIVVVPVRITGDIRDPRVRVLEAAAVGATLVNLMKATFKAPIQLLDFGSRSGTTSGPGKE